MSDKRRLLDVKSKINHLKTADNDDKIYTITCSLSTHYCQ